MNYDTIIIGAGHNGLVCAAFLAKAGHKVLVLERRETLGGAAATEERFPGFKINTGAHDAGRFLPEIVNKLNLQEHGLDFIESSVAVFAPQPDGRALTLWRDQDKNPEEIRRFSEADADKFQEFCEMVHRFAGVLRTMLTLTPPDFKQKTLGEFFPWSKFLFNAKRLGKREMMPFLRLLPMSVKQFLDEWFEAEALKGTLGSTGVIGSMQGPYADGTAFLWLYHYLGAANGGFRSCRFVRGGIGNLSKALADVAREHGAEIRTGLEVSQIKVRNYKAVGVCLVGGEEIATKTVISSADPKRTFLSLVGAPNLGPQFIRKVRNIRYRGSTAKLNLALSELPCFAASPDSHQHLSGHIIICPSLEYLERAYDDAKYGRFSKKPYLDVIIPTLLDSSLAPTGKHLMSITIQYAPYNLREGNWDEQRDKLADSTISVLAEYAPGLSDIILHKQLLTPLDWEREYGLTEGSIFHGQMGLDQLLFMRPIPGFGRYRTPIGKLYLCGAGTHPGGGVTGAPGYNCAREVLKDKDVKR